MRRASAFLTVLYLVLDSQDGNQQPMLSVMVSKGTALQLVIVTKCRGLMRIMYKMQEDEAIVFKYKYKFLSVRKIDFMLATQIAKGESRIGWVHLQLSTASLKHPVNACITLG